MGQYAVHGFQVISRKRNRQAPKEVRLLFGQAFAVHPVPVRDPDSTAVAAALGFDGIPECELTDVPADRPLTDTELRRQIFHGALAKPVRALKGKDKLADLGPADISSLAAHARKSVKKNRHSTRGRDKTRHKHRL